MKKIKTVDDYLNEVNYEELNTGNYIPSKFALKFLSYIKLITMDNPESHATPVLHLKMLDQIANSKEEEVANLVFRGASKTTLFAEYLIPIIAIEGGIDGFGDISGIIYISDTMENGVRNLKNNLESRYEKSSFLKEWLPKAKLTDSSIEFTNKAGHKVEVRCFGAATSCRGVKMFGKRPTLAILDDLISDKIGTSKAMMQLIQNAVYSGLEFALDPSQRKIIWNGTPFHKEDVLYTAVESGSYSVNVYPVCEKFPCSREEFRGAWEERFSYDFILKAYNKAKANNQLAAFNKEMMLRISSSEDQLVQDNEIRWFSKKDLMHQRSNFNFYITTDFATSAKTTSDYSVISVWAYSNNGDLFWVDGICVRQTMDKTVDKLFELCQEYRPQGVGIERSGQQGGFISWISSEQLKRNIFFNIARQKGKTDLGIYPNGDKLSRFNLAVPLFREGKIHFPTELRETSTITEFLSEISLATVNGLKGKDDCLDTISMLQEMNLIKPSLASNKKIHSDNNAYFVNDYEDEYNQINSYLVD